MKFLEVADPWSLDIPDQVLHKYRIAGLIMATTAYRHTSVDEKVQIALYMHLGFMADDDVIALKALQEFVPRLGSARPQLHPALGRLVEQLTALREYYPIYNVNAVLINTLDFFNAEMFSRTDGGTMVHGLEGSEYMRWKSGLGEAFAALIWPRSQFPETSGYIQAIPYVISTSHSQAHGHE